MTNLSLSHLETCCCLVGQVTLCSVSIPVTTMTSEAANPHCPVLIQLSRSRHTRPSNTRRISLRLSDVIWIKLVDQFLLVLQSPLGPYQAVLLKVFLVLVSEQVSSDQRQQRFCAASQSWEAPKTIRAHNLDQVTPGPIRSSRLTCQFDTEVTNDLVRWQCTKAIAVSDLGETWFK